MYIWNAIRKFFQEKIEDMGIEETNFPMFLSSRSLEKVSDLFFKSSRSNLGNIISSLHIWPRTPLVQRLTSDTGEVCIRDIGTFATPRGLLVHKAHEGGVSNMLWDREHVEGFAPELAWVTKA